MADATFTVGGNTVTFGFMIDGASHSRKAAVNVEHIPGSNTVYVDRAGLDAIMLKGKGNIASYADMILLLSLGGQSGTLTFSEATYTATLISASESRIVGTGRRFVDFEFVVTG